MAQFFDTLQSANAAYSNVLTAVLRYGAPVVAFLLLFRCIISMLTFRREPETWGWFWINEQTRLPITHWENVIGRSKRSDIVLEVPTVSRTHGVLTRYDDGSWTIADHDSSGGILVNGKKIKHIRALQNEDIISIGGVEMVLQPISRRQEQRLAQLRTKASSLMSGFVNVFLLTVFQLLCCLEFLLGG